MHTRIESGSLMQYILYTLIQYKLHILQFLVMIWKSIIQDIRFDAISKNGSTVTKARLEPQTSRIVVHSASHCATHRCKLVQNHQFNPVSYKIKCLKICYIFKRIYCVLFPKILTWQIPLVSFILWLLSY